MLIVYAGEAPYYLNMMSAEERSGIRNRESSWQSVLNSMGISTGAFGDWMDDSDHFDRPHLSEKGGEKFAALVAGAIVEKARALGYVE